MTTRRSSIHLGGGDALVLAGALDRLAVGVDRVVVALEVLLAMDDGKGKFEWNRKARRSNARIWSYESGC